MNTITEESSDISRERTSSKRAVTSFYGILLAILVFSFNSISVNAAEIYIDRVGDVQVDLLDLTDPTSVDLRNDTVPDFNSYISRWDLVNPIEWVHTWDISNPNAGSIALDADESYTPMIAAELFPVVWDVDYPSSDEHDVLFWDIVPYGGAGGAGFDPSLNPGAWTAGYIEGQNNYWGAKRITLNASELGPGDVEYFWLQVDEEAGGVNWRSSLDYSDLSIIFNPGALDIKKEIISVTGFNPPRVGYTTTYTVRLTVSNPTTTDTGGPMYEVKVADAFPAGTTITAAPSIGAAAIDAAGNLAWNIGILQDGYLNVPPAANSYDVMEFQISVTPTVAQAGAPVTINSGAAIDGKQVPEDPGDGYGTMFPFNFYTDPDNSESDNTPLLQSLNVVPSNTGVLTTTATIIPSGAIAISVTDADLNFATGVVETVTVVLVNQNNGESEQLTCTETGANTGIFEATLASSFGLVSGIDNDSDMNVQAGDVVRATYNDAVDVTGNPLVVTSDTNVLGGTTGTIVSTTPIIPTAVVTVTVTDADLNTDAAVIETFSLLTTNSRSGEQEMLTYTETGVNTGVFEATVNTAYGAVAGADNDGTMKCVAGDALETVYNDNLNNIGTTGTVTATTDVIGGVDGTFTMTATITPTGNIAVDVTDSDLNTNAGVAETIAITLTNAATGESEVVTLTETGVNTGVLQATIATVFGTAAGANNDGTFNVQAGNVINGSYSDNLRADGGTSTLDDSTTVIGGADATVTSTATIIPGDVPTFTVTDTDLNTNPAAVESYNFTIVNTVTGEQETVVFTETGINTGGFEATIATVFGAAAGADNSGSFNVQSGDSLKLTYNDALTTAGGTAILSTTTAVNGGDTATITSPATLFPGNSIAVSLSDADLNTDPALAESVVINAVDTTSGETEIITLTETGVSTGIFAATVSTAYTNNAPVNNNGVFNVINGHSVTFTYNDILMTNGNAQVITTTTDFEDIANTITVTGPSGSHNTSNHDITGSTDPNSTVTVPHPITGVILSVNATATGSFSFAGVAFPEGTSNFTVTSTDLSGNVATDNGSVFVDTLNAIAITAPAAGITIGALQDDFTGTTDPNSTVKVVEPSTGATLTLVADAAGNFTFLNVGLNEGLNNLTFTSTDPLTNVATTNTNITCDTQTTVDITSLTNGDLFNTTDHTIAGTAEPGATVTTTHPTSGAPLSVVADGAGNYTFGAVTFPEGSNTVTVQSTDLTANTANANVTITVDLTINLNITSIANGALYNVSTHAISGQTDAFSTVTTTHPTTGAPLTTNADAAGGYTFGSFSFPDGNHTVTVSATDPAGNNAVEAVNFDVDTTIFNTVATSGSFATHTIAISGNTEPGCTVTLTDPVSGAVRTEISDGAGAYTFAGVNFPEGTTTITTSSKDPAGNIAVDSSNILVDTLNSVTVVSPAAGSFINNANPAVTGTTDPLSTVNIIEPNTGAVLTVVADAAGNYTFPNVAMFEGVNTLNVTSIDPLGNVAGTSPKITVDLTIVLNLTSVTDGASYNTPDHSIAGVTDPQATVTTPHPVTGAALTAIADGAGNYSFGPFSLPDNTYNVTVNSADQAGNTASVSASFIVNTVNTNNLLTSGVFTTSTIEVRGTTDPNSAVQFVNPVNGATLNTVSDSAGNYTFGNIVFPDASYTLTTTSTDPYGNAASDVKTILVDTVIVLSIDNIPDNSIVRADAVDIVGTTDANSTVTLTDPATGETYTTTADAAGSYSFNNVNLNYGPNAVTVNSTDPAGNTATVTHNIISYPNLAITISNPRDGSVVTSNSQDLTGRTDPNVTVTTKDPQTGASITTTSNASGIYTFPNLLFTDGWNTISVSTTDFFGSTLEAGSTFVVAHEGNDGALQASIRTVIGNSIHIMVEDNESYLNPAAVDTVPVTVTNPATGDTETVDLTETAVNSGVFKGTITTVEQGGSGAARVASAVAGNGLIEANIGDVVTTTYLDLIRADLSTDVPLRAATEITNDAVRIMVSATAVNGHVTQEPLVQRPVSIIEFDTSGNYIGTVASYTTTADGHVPSEFISLMQYARHYRVTLNEYYKGMLYSQSRAFDLTTLENITPDARGVRTLTVVLDPTGIVYDAISGQPIDGADIVLYHEGNQPAQGPFSNHTRAPEKRQANPQITGDCGVDGGFEFIGSSNGSDIHPGGYFVTVTFDSSQQLDDYYKPVLRSEGSWAGIHRPYTGQVFRVSYDNEPIGMRIPLQPAAFPTALNVTKSANKEKVAVGEIVTFSVTVTNLTNVQTDPANPVVAVDTIPTGLEFVPGSAVLSTGALVPIQLSANTVRMTLVSLMPSGDPTGADSVTVYYQATVDVSVEPGSFLTNTVLAEINTLVQSNTAQSTIQVKTDPIFDMATLIGKVFEDVNENGYQDDGELGIAGAGVLLDDGTYVVADADGKFSIPGVKPMMNISGYRAVKIDKATLPAGSEITSDETKLIRLAPGGIAKANFGVKLPENADSSDNYGDYDRAAGTDGAHEENTANDKGVENLLLAFIDVAAGEVKSGAGEQYRTNTAKFAEGGFFNARAAFFFDGKIKKLRITSSYDSEKEYNLDISPDRNRDDYYPTYGDDSKVSYLANSRGKFFIFARKNGFKLLHGNFTAKFENTDLAGIRRSLYGSRLQMERTYSSFGLDHRGTLDVFTSLDKQLHARNEFKSTGSSHYYLAHQDLVAGSEEVTVETRNSFAGDRVKTTRTLSRDSDYEVDYNTGAIRLVRPLPLTAHSDQLNYDGLFDGDEIWVVVEYSYMPERNDNGTLGVRWQHSFNEKVAIGTTFMSENVNGDDQELRAADFHLMKDDYEMFSLELAESNSGGTPWFSSLDSGRSFTQLGNRGTARGNAIKADFMYKFSKKFAMESYFYAVDPEFSGTFNERGVKRGGAKFTFKDARREWTLEYTRASAIGTANSNSVLNTDGGNTEALRLNYKQELTQDSSFEVEYLHRDSNNRNIAYGIERGNNDNVAARYDKELSEKASMYIKQQFTFNGDKNHQSTLGLSYRLGKGMFATVEGSVGSNGTGGRLQFEKATAGGASVYAGIETGSDGGDDGTRITTGIAGPVSDDTDAYMDYGSTSRDNETTIHRTMGIRHKFGDDGKLKVHFSLERSEENSSINGNYVTNAAAVSLKYKLKKINIAADFDYSKQSGSISQKNFGAYIQADGKITNDLSLLGEYNYVISSDVASDSTESKYTKAIVGLAYRPARHDRINIIAKAARIREKRVPSVNVLLTPDTVTHIYAIEGLFELTPGLVLNQKFATKKVRETVGNMPAGNSRTNLYISGINWQLTPQFDLNLEYRNRSQNISSASRGGFAIETGYTIKEHLRIGVGYNFSGFNGDVMSADDHSARGVFFRLQYKY